MAPTTHEAFTLNSEELALLAQLLEAQRASLLIQVRHADHRAYRDELRRRLNLVEHLSEICQHRSATGGQ